MLVDTSGLVCYFDIADHRDQEAVTLFTAAHQLLTHSYILAEFVPVCNARRLNRTDALLFATDLIENNLVEVVRAASSSNCSASETTRQDLFGL